MANISAVIITKNEAQNIARCIRSAKLVADEILIFDSNSTDNTTAIAEAEGAVVHLIEWQGYARTKNLANSKAANNFILSLDADEEVSEELVHSILEVKPGLQNAYSFNRLNNYCGRWIKHGGFYPDKKIRLFNRNLAQWEGDFVHEELVVQPNIQVQHLQGDLLHYTYSSLSDHLKRIDRYSDLAAKKFTSRGIKPPAYKLLLNPLARFVRNYFIRGGFRDGIHGLCLCMLTSWEVFLKYAKVLVAPPAEEE